jgi:hypothetical protein
MPLSIATYASFHLQVYIVIPILEVNRHFVQQGTLNYISSWGRTFAMALRSTLYQLSLFMRDQVFFIHPIREKWPRNLLRNCLLKWNNGENLCLLKFIDYFSLYCHSLEVHFKTFGNSSTCDLYFFVVKTIVKFIRKWYTFIRLKAGHLQKEWPPCVILTK